MLTPLLRIKSIGVNWDHVYQIRKGGVGRMSFIIERMLAMEEEDRWTISMTEGEVSWAVIFLKVWRMSGVLDMGQFH